jgi:membrane-associated protease RseP (regulator of RpoE activity)
VSALAQVAFFLALVVVIVIHEAAHFGMAKRFGIKVEEFFVGFGPRLWSRRRGETEYGVKLLPAGGYVRIAGMNPFEEIAPEDLPRTFGAKPIHQRALVILAGPVTHFLLAFVVFAGWLGLVGQPTIVSPLISVVAPTLEGAPSPAAAAGLRAGDRIVRVGDLDAPTDEELVAATRASVGRPLTLLVERAGERFEVTLTPVLSTVDGEEAGRIGVALGQAREAAGFLGSITGAGRLLALSVVTTAESLGRVFGPDGIGRIAELLFTDAPREATDAASIVGVTHVAGQAAAAGRFGDVFYLFAVVNVFIGLLNLLPLPPFDGGHLAVLAIERLRRRPVDPRRLIPVSIAVAGFLILFTFSVVWLDLVKPISLTP